MLITAKRFAGGGRTLGKRAPAWLVAGRGREGTSSGIDRCVDIGGVVCWRGASVARSYVAHFVR